MVGRTTAAPEASPRLLHPADLDVFLSLLQRDGFRLIGPTRRDNAIVYDDIASTADLPAGWTDEQAPGHYRLRQRADDAWFGYAVGPHSWKRYLQPAAVRLWSARRRGSTFELEAGDGPNRKLAFIAVRACELAAIGRQDQVLRDGPYADHAYADRRLELFIIAVQCSTPSRSCFCTSMGTGPRVTCGYDVALTEIVDGPRHVFVAVAGTSSGAHLLDALHLPAASEDENAAADAVVEEASRQIARTFNVEGVREALLRNSEDPRWDAVADRCVTCSNCTMACPTCFCTTVEDTADLTGARAERWRRWDSCFSVEFSYLHGGSVRSSPRSRYRQWLTHKLSTWWDQFGVSGCVGCGRCITWCPVGIDMTIEAGAIRDQAGLAGGADEEPSHGDNRAVVA